MGFNFKDPRKAAVVFCTVNLVLFLGIAVYCLISNQGWLLTAVFLLFAVLSTLPIIAAVNRKTTLRESDFTYRTWLGNEYEFKYTDVVYYVLTDHDVWIHTRDKLLVVDRDSENGNDMAKKLELFNIPDKDPMAKEGISDEKGEQAAQVIYRDQRKVLTWVCFGAALLSLGLAVMLFFYGAPFDDSFGELLSFVLLEVFLVSSAVLLAISALYYRNGRVEMYRDHFIYRNWRGKPKSYSYKDCVSKRVRNYQDGSRTHFKAAIRMNDGSKIRVDHRMLESGFGASIGFNRLRKR
ncbi:MAG: hypothetical protein K6G56_00030 [Clostridiales bacterium]|nr:hypothetical protein [Clostridiales bacterium]